MQHLVRFLVLLPVQMDRRQLHGGLGDGAVVLQRARDLERLSADAEGLVEAAGRSEDARDAAERLEDLRGVSLRPVDRQRFLQHV